MIELKAHFKKKQVLRETSQYLVRHLKKHLPLSYLSKNKIY